MIALLIISSILFIAVGVWLIMKIVVAFDVTRKEIEDLKHMSESTSDSSLELAQNHRNLEGDFNITVVTLHAVIGQLQKRVNSLEGSVSDLNNQSFASPYGNRTPHADCVEEVNTIIHTTES